MNNKHLIDAYVGIVIYFLVSLLLIPFEDIIDLYRRLEGRIAFNYITAIIDLQSTFQNLRDHVKEDAEDNVMPRSWETFSTEFGKK